VQLHVSFQCFEGNQLTCRILLSSYLDPDCTLEWRVSCNLNPVGTLLKSTNIAVPVLAGAAGASAVAAYLNAKFHISHNLKNARSSLVPF
jgi:hypothetical protein